jgi:aspartyl-tRNA(Asn)/glutamyl-tRNA(Gln) amidotransferase subunit A
MKAGAAARVEVGDLERAGLVDMSGWISDRAMTPLDLTRAVLNRCEQLDAKINAFITIDASGALEAAERAEVELRRGRYRGRLHGIPVGVKDIFRTRGLRTTAGSRTMAGYVPDEDSAVVELLRRAGAIVVGKTNTPEFAYSPCDQYHPEFGPTRNPWDLDRFPGASSGGSAAAVAARMVPIAIGSDTGGSVRTPAAFCGVTGFKPTFGLVSMWGAVPLSPTMDHVGFLGQTARDCAALLAATAKHDARDPASVPASRRRVASVPRASRLDGLRIGLLEGFFSEELQPGVAHVFEETVATLAGLGVHLERLPLHGLLDSVNDAVAILAVEASYTHASDLAHHSAELVPDVRSKLERGNLVSGVEYVRARAARRRVRALLAEMLDRVDVMVSPTCDSTAPRMDDDGRVLDPPPYLAAGRPSARIPFNLAGLPAISIPCGTDELGLPVGLQIIGRQLHDFKVLAIASEIQSATEWHLGNPGLGDRLPSITESSQVRPPT